MKRLYRSRKDKILGGVCGGLAEYFVIDTALVRLLWLLSVILGGAGVLAYIIGWIIIPDQPLAAVRSTSNNGEGQAVWTVDADPDADAGNEAGDGAKRSSLAGLILIGLGGLFLLRQFFPFWDLGRLWPLILIAVGIIFILRGIRGE